MYSVLNAESGLKQVGMALLIAGCALFLLCFCFFFISLVISVIKKKKLDKTVTVNQQIVEEKLSELLSENGISQEETETFEDDTETSDEETEAFTE